MKKFILFGVAISLGLSPINAEKISGITLKTPHWMPNAAIQKISPDGKYAVSSVYGTMVIYNLETGDAWGYEGDDMGQDYTAGNGNCFSLTGTMVGCTKSTPDAMYWESGEWHALPIPNVSGSFLSDGITADGTRICGSISTQDRNNDGLMLVPAYWDRNEDGSYSMPVTLPYPKTDFSGRTPQYVTALCISDDGKTIAGQIRDYSGFLCEPILYKCNTEGEWSYELIGRKLLNPNDIECPPYPGDGPAIVQPENYMSESERAAYEEAYQDWIDEGDWDPENEPNPLDYLSESEKAAYEADKAKYAEWEEEFLKFSTAIQQIELSGTSVLFNNVFLSGDGKYAAYTGIQAEVDKTGETEQFQVPVVFNLEENTHVIFDKKRNITLSDLGDDGTLYGTYREGIEPEAAYILPAGKSEFEPLITYVSTKNAELGKWMEETMTQNVATTSGEEIKLITGTPFCSADQEVIGGYCLNYWGGDNGTPCYAYLFSWESDPNEVKIIASKMTLGAKAAGSGKIELSEQCDMEIFTTEGVKIFTGKNLKGIVDTRLSAGIYIIKLRNDKSYLTKKISL